VTLVEITFTALLIFACLIGLAQMANESGDDGWGF